MNKLNISDITTQINYLMLLRETLIQEESCEIIVREIEKLYSLSNTPKKRQLSKMRRICGNFYSAKTRYQEKEIPNIEKHSIYLYKLILEELEKMKKKDLLPLEFYVFELFIQNLLTNKITFYDINKLIICSSNNDNGLFD